MEEFLIVDSLAERAALSALTILRLAEGAAMSCRIRAARPEDAARALRSRQADGGRVHQPARRQGRRSRPSSRDRKPASPAQGEAPGDDLYVFMLEDYETKAIRGTCQVFGQVGSDRPFYSYRHIDADPEERGAGADLPQPDAQPDHRPRRDRARSAGCSSIHTSVQGGSACCSRGAAICSSSSTGRALPGACSPNCAG